MKLPFSFDDVDPIWIDGSLPLQKKDRRVAVQLAGTSGSYFPRAVNKIGDLLLFERPSPLQHAVSLLLSYPYSTVPIGGPPPKDGEWSEVPGSTIYRQIRIALPADAISQVREVDGDEYGYELTLNDVELEERNRQR